MAAAATTAFSSPMSLFSPGTSPTLTDPAPLAHGLQPSTQKQERRGPAGPVLTPAARELLAGFAAGAANVTSGYPFDTIKVRLQGAAPGQYRGAVHCLREVVRSDGVRRGLFRGLSSPLVGGTAETGVNYLVYSRVLEALQPRPDSTSGATAAGGPTRGSLPPLQNVAVAGAVAGVCLSIILGPTELVKCRMQQAGSATLYPGGPLQCLRQIVVSEGGLVRGLGRGLGATLAREVPGNALFFTAYEGLRRWMRTANAPAAAAVGHHPPGSFSASASSCPCREGVPLAQTHPEAGQCHGAPTALADGGPGWMPLPRNPHPAHPHPHSPPTPHPPHQTSTGIPLAQPQQRHGGSDLAESAAVGPPEGGSAAPRANGRGEPSGEQRLKEALATIFCGGAAGTIMWAAVLPIDVAKTRLQTARPGTPWDVGLRRHWAMLWREGGLRSLYAGLLPTLTRAFPANACQWLAWEVTMRGLRGEGEWARGRSEEGHCA